VQDLPSNVRSRRHVRIHATILFFLLSAAFLAVCIVSLMRLVDSGYSLESYQTQGGSAHRAPRLCVQIDDTVNTTLLFEARTILDQNKVRLREVIETVPEQLRVGDGQFVNLTCVRDASNLTIQVCVRV
jgi:hypothetical protein